MVIEAYRATNRSTWDEEWNGDGCHGCRIRKGKLRIGHGKSDLFGEEETSMLSNKDRMNRVGRKVREDKNTIIHQNLGETDKPQDPVVASLHEVPFDELPISEGIELHHWRAEIGQSRSLEIRVGCRRQGTEPPIRQMRLRRPRRRVVKRNRRGIPHPMRRPRARGRAAGDGAAVTPALSVLPFHRKEKQ